MDLLADIETRRRRLESELERCKRHKASNVRDAVIAALEDRLRALGRAKGAQSDTI